MNITDYLIIIFIILFTIKGFKNGAIKEIVIFGGLLIVLVLAYFLKNPVSIFLYERLPFIDFGGMLTGISVLNIIFYELISFFLVAGVLMLFYRLLIMATNIVDIILKATIILEIPSKILGIFVGFVEGITIIFIFLFITYQFSYTKEYIDKSKYGNEILIKTPILSSATNSIYNSVQEIYNITKDYQNSEDKAGLNLRSLNILLKYKVIEPKNALTLIENNKLKIEGAVDLIDSYIKEESE